MGGFLRAYSPPMEPGTIWMTKRIDSSDTHTLTSAMADSCCERVLLVSLTRKTPLRMGMSPGLSTQHHQ